MSNSRSVTSESLRWPALQSEQHPWVSKYTSDALTRAQQDRVRQPYSSAIVPQIAAEVLSALWEGQMMRTESPTPQRAAPAP